LSNHTAPGEGLLNGLNLMGVPTRQVERPGEHDRDQGPVCFEVPSNYEIVFDGKKLVGSAQMRKAGVVLQHGALPLHGDIARISLYLAKHPAAERVRQSATTVEAAIGRGRLRRPADGTGLRGRSICTLNRVNSLSKSRPGPKNSGARSMRRMNGRTEFDE
jgi:hypothetical protein